MLPFCAETLGIRSSKFSMVPAFSRIEPTTVVIMPPFFKMVLGREDFTTTSPSILASSQSWMMPTFSPWQSRKAVLYEPEFFLKIFKLRYTM